MVRQLRDSAKTAAKINVQAARQIDKFPHFPGAIWNVALFVLGPCVGLQWDTVLFYRLLALKKL